MHGSVFSLFSPTLKNTQPRFWFSSELLKEESSVLRLAATARARPALYLPACLPPKRNQNPTRRYHGTPGRFKIQFADLQHTDMLLERLNRRDDRCNHLQHVLALCIHDARQSQRGSLPACLYCPVSLDKSATIDSDMPKLVPKTHPPLLATRILACTL